MRENAGVLFDLDETLVNRHASLTRYAAALWQAHRHLVALDEQQFITCFHDIDKGGRTPRKVFFERFTADVLPHVSATDFENHFFDGAWAEPMLFDDAVSVLGALRGHGYRIGIISNGSQRPQSAKIRNSALRELVDEVLISESCGMRKPDPAIFAAMAERLDLDISRSWFVGDDPIADVVGAEAAGFTSVWIERHTPWPAGDAAVYHARIITLAELPRLMGLV